jgi:RNA recognition motif-containing protein
MKKIYVGNLSWSTTDAELQDLFSQYGNVQSARVITDRETGRSRGFGFVEMDDADAPKAISELDGRDFAGRNLRVNEAQERPRRDGGGGGNRGGGGGGGGGGGRW